MESIRNSELCVVWWWWNFWKFIVENVSKIVRKTNIILENDSQDDIELKISNSDIIVFSVPIRNTRAIIKDLSDKLVWDKLVIDISWLKSETSDGLISLDVNERVSLHPMFAPFNGSSLNNKNIIVTEDMWWFRWKVIRRLLIHLWANIRNISSKNHDEKMSVIQALPHIINMIFIMVLKELDIHPTELEELSTPIYRLQSLVWWRFLNQSADLYADMQINNSEFINNVLPAVMNSVKKITEIDLWRNHDDFVELFLSLSEFLWEDFLSKSLSNTQKIQRTWII